MSLLSQKKSFLVEILLLVLFVLVLNIALYTLIRLRQNTNESEINSLIERNSRWKELTDDPCKWAIMGDPLATENSFVKLNLYCEDGKSSINTYDLRGIKTNNVAELISKHSSLHGINEVSFGTSKYLLSGLG